MKGKSSNSKYQVGRLVFPSENIYKIIVSIDKEFRKLYSPGYVNSKFRSIPYSEVRDDQIKIEALLNRVEEKINKISRKVNIEQNDEEVFRNKFCGITDFLYEASEFSELKDMDALEKRFYGLANRLFNLDIHPIDFRSRK